MHINNSVIAHRGASAYAPENTIVAFNQALALGSTCVEFDVMLTADGQAVVFHDEYLIRTTNGQGDMGRCTYAYIQTLDAGGWFSPHYQNEKVPTFQAVIQWLNDHNINANVEIKPYPGTCEATSLEVINLIKNHWLAGKVGPIVSSFDFEALAICKKIAPELKLGLLMHEWNQKWLETAKELNCYSIHCSAHSLTQARAQLIKQQGYQLYVYTVNRKRKANTLLSWGVDAVFSDYPDLLS